MTALQLAEQKYTLEPYLDIMTLKHGAKHLECPYSTNANGEFGQRCGSWCALFRVEKRTVSVPEYDGRPEDRVHSGYYITQGCSEGIPSIIVEDSEAK